LGDFRIGCLIRPGDRHLRVAAHKRPVGSHALVGAMTYPVDLLQLRHVDVATREIEDKPMVLLVDENSPLRASQLKAITGCGGDRIAAPQEVDAIIEALAITGTPTGIDSRVGHELFP